MALARLLVAGVDVWLNNPISPLEASGTSGIKAAINGTVNLSVLDGWWAEGFDGENGWAIVSAASGNEQERDREDAQTLYELLEDEVIPLYYARNEQGLFARVGGEIQALDGDDHSALQHAPGARELRAGLYRPAAQCAQALAADAFAGRACAGGMERQGAACLGARRICGISTQVPRGLDFGGRLQTRVAAFLNGLDPGDVRVELVLRAGARRTAAESRRRYTSLRR